MLSRYIGKSLSKVNTHLAHNASLSVVMPTLQPDNDFNPTKSWIGVSTPLVYVMRPMRWPGAWRVRFSPLCMTVMTLTSKSYRWSVGMSNLASFRNTDGHGGKPWYILTLGFDWRLVIDRSSIRLEKKEDTNTFPVSKESNWNKRVDAEYHQ